MTKRIAVLLCALCVTVSAATLPALAAEQHYPVSVEEYTCGSEPRIKKVYQLALSDSPSGIPTGDFNRNGRHYFLLDLIRQDEVGVDTQPYTETVTMDSDTGDMSSVLRQLDGDMEVTTEDGYAGTLILDHTSIKVEVKGYKTSTKNLSATRTYPSLSEADLDLIPKTTTDGGKTLTLADVQWASDGTYYTATAKYTGTSSSRYATGYTVSAAYTGEVAKTECSVVIYTAIFGSEELPPAEQDVEESCPPEIPVPDTTPDPSIDASPSTDPDAGAGKTAAPAELPIGTNVLSVLGCAGGVVSLVSAALWSVQKFMERGAQK
ncbi:MAG: hypothetical protein K2K53_05070 [Oscillospiraceae bacterium]|nr:hypothetical protein [Oscillospiraceae bacterium]